jgi:hypothetical protein
MQVYLLTCISNALGFFLFVCLFCGSTGVWPQGLHLSYSASSFLWFFFF